jgi:hypothetical protein
MELQAASKNNGHTVHYGSSWWIGYLVNRPTQHNIHHAVAEWAFLLWHHHPHTSSHSLMKIFEDSVAATIDLARMPQIASTNQAYRHPITWFLHSCCQEVDQHSACDHDRASWCHHSKTSSPWPVQVFVSTASCMVQETSVRKGVSDWGLRMAYGSTLAPSIFLTSLLGLPRRIRRLQNLHISTVHVWATVHIAGKTWDESNGEGSPCWTNMRTRTKRTREERTRMHLYDWILNVIEYDWICE